MKRRLQARKIGRGEPAPALDFDTAAVDPDDGVAAGDGEGDEVEDDEHDVVADKVEDLEHDDGRRPPFPAGQPRGVAGRPVPAPRDVGDPQVV